MNAYHVAILIPVVVAATATYAIARMRCAARDLDRRSER